MSDSVFTKIINHEIPAHRLYEDDHVLAFLDANPLSDGHSLVVPKEPAKTIDELSDDASAAIGRVLPRLTRAILKATGATSCNILQNNGADAHQAVMHVHFHIIPRFPDKAPGGEGLTFNWTAHDLEREHAHEIEDAIKAALA